MSQGISRLTATMIKYGEITADVTGPVDGKHGFWITLWRDGRPHISPLIIAAPHYDTKEAAETAMRELLGKIKADERI